MTQLVKRAPPDNIRYSRKWRIAVEESFHTTPQSFHTDPLHKPGKLGNWQGGISIRCSILCSIMFVIVRQFDLLWILFDIVVDIRQDRSIVQAEQAGRLAGRQAGSGQ
jgi:hypothetical protein